jgi:hypothetical protein
MLEEEFDLDDDQPKHQKSLNLRKAKRPVQSAVVGQTSDPWILKELSLLQEAIDRNKYLAHWQKWNNEDPSDLNQDVTTPENVAMPNKVVPFNLDGHNSPFGAGACGVGDPRRLASVMPQQSMENLGQLLSERGELRNTRDELKERETNVENRLNRLGISRRDLGRISALAAGGAALPLYNDAALAQLSMRMDVSADIVRINANENPLGPCPEAVEDIFAAIIKRHKDVSASPLRIIPNENPLGPCHEAAEAIFIFKRLTAVRALLSEYAGICAHLIRVNRELFAYDVVISRALAKQRSNAKRFRNVVQQQRPFFIMNSFHPPDAALTATASAFGGFAMAA